MAVDEFGNEIVEDDNTTTPPPVTDDVGEGTPPGALPPSPSDPYGELAGKREAATVPDYSGYEASKTAPDVASGGAFVTAESTVAGQLEKILQRGSPLQDLAETRAREQASALGMMSSSAGIGAGQKALYDTALQVATPDALAAKEFQLQEQAALNTQVEVATEAQVAGDLTVQKAKIAEQTKAINDSFALQLAGLDKDTEANLLDQKAKWDEKFKALDSEIALKLQQQEIDSQVEQKIMNQSHDMMNQYQISIQQLLANQAFLDSMPSNTTANPTAARDGMNAIFDDMFQTTVASIEFSANAANIYDASFQTYLDDLVASSSWSGV